MNRREAIAALTSLPGLTSVQVADLKPNDVIVAEFEGRLSSDQMSQIQAQLNSVWPRHRVVVMDSECRLKVMRDVPQRPQAPENRRLKEGARPTR
jgi:hypothetical protein